MTSLTDFAITGRWPPRHPDRIQLYSFPTQNGVKVSIALEEMGLPYEAHRVTLSRSDVKSPEFLSLNPNGKIPAIIDPKGPEGEPVGIFESGAILIYLAEKSGMLLPKDAVRRFRTIQWLMFQMSGIGPMFGQLGFFYKFAGTEIEDPRPRDHYTRQARRLLDVVEGQLDGKDWITGTYSIADIALAPWLNALENYHAAEAVGWQDYKRSVAYVNRFYEREAVNRGANIPQRD